jgi:hypothetical protein
MNRFNTINLIFKEYKKELPMNMTLNILYSIITNCSNVYKTLLNCTLQLCEACFTVYMHVTCQHMLLVGL